MEVRGGGIEGIFMVCSYSAVELLGIVITVFEPNSEKWFDFLRGKP